MDHWYVTAPGTIERIEEPAPEPGAGQVRVRIAHTAISPGSNLHVYRTGSYAADGRRSGKRRCTWAAGSWMRWAPG